MSYPFNYPTPTNANVQIFVGGGTNAVSTARIKTWVKPQGASFVWFTLIGAGGSGIGTYSGASGAVTNCLMPAFLIPDSFLVSVGNEGSQLSTNIVYQGSRTANGYTVLTANRGASATGGAASTSNAFSAAGFFQSVAGEDGLANGAISGTTFLSSGATAGSSITANYGYTVPVGSINGFFQTRPIIVGLGGVEAGNGGIGCGGGANSGAVTNAGRGGAGMAVIISW